MAELKSGPLTKAEIQALWEGAVDKNYRDPFLSAGEGNGFEAWTQLFEVFSRVSTAIDITTQAMFISPWSGQSNPASAGAARATVTLTFRRTKLLDRPLRLGAGLVFVGEDVTDWGVDGPVEVQTGRRYTLTEDLIFHPGEQGPFDVVCIAEEVGYGYNNPRATTITAIAQPGTGFNNDNATVTTLGPLAPLPTQTAAQAKIVTDNQADTFVPEHVGQYMQFGAGSNAGLVGRVSQFFAPMPPLTGSTVQLEILHSIMGTVFAGMFLPGELLEFKNGAPVVAYGTFAGDRVTAGTKKLSYVLLSGGSVGIATTITGLVSGATMTVSQVLYAALFTAETLTAQWRVLDWAQDWGLAATNVLAPTGGRAGFLDELGLERGLNRAPGEDDNTYRQRVREIADVVSPNAIRRTLNRVMGTIPWCFREVGHTELRGWFYDGRLDVSGNPLPAGGPNNTTLSEADLYDAYDTDVIVFTGVLTSGTFRGPPLFPGENEKVVLEDASSNVSATGYFGRLDAGDTIFTFIRKSGAAPTSLVGLSIRGLFSGAIFTPAAVMATPTVNQRRFRYELDYTQFRAFFLIGVPRLGAGEFGFAYDAGPSDAYDASPYWAFYDGYAYLAALFYLRIAHAIDATRAAGVTWQPYVEEIGCP